MISLYGMPWYHKMWFIPLVIIAMLIQLPYYIVTAPFRKS